MKVALVVYVEVSQEPDEEGGGHMGPLTLRNTAAEAVTNAINLAYEEGFTHHFATRVSIRPAGVYVLPGQ